MKPLFASSFMSFSYGQFLVCDATVEGPELEWTDNHSAQGFARSDRQVCFATMIDAGVMDLAIYVGPFASDAQDERVIQVPFSTTSSKVTIGGLPGMHPVVTISLWKGDYRLVAAQHVLNEDSIAVSVYFERCDQPLLKSQILLADDRLTPPIPLLELASPFQF